MVFCLTKGEKLKTGKKINLKHSIRVQFAAIFIVLLIGTIACSWIINSLFLQQYYIKNKQEQIEESYTAISQLFDKYSSTTDDNFRTDFMKITSTGNLSVVVADSSLKIVASSVNESDMLMSRLTWHIFSDEDSTEPMGPENTASKNAARGGQNNPPEGASENSAGNGSAGMENGGNGGKQTQDKILDQNNNYVIKTSTDPRMATDYIELWGTLGNGDVIFIRTPVESIRESVVISNRFLAYIGIIMAIIGALIIWFVSKKITDPITELSDISDRMAHLDFDAKYTSG